MANKGINTIIDETRREIVKSVNDGINKGLPIAIIDLMLDSIVMEVKNGLNNALINERQKYEEESKVESDQIVYEDKENDENMEQIETE